MENISITVVLCSVNALLVGVLGWFLNDLISQLREQIRALALENKAQNDRLETLLQGYVQMEPHMIMHQNITERLNSHSERLRAVEAICAAFKKSGGNRA